MRLCAFADEASASVTGQIAALKRNGFTSLEVRGVNGTNVSKITNDEAKELRSMLDSEGLDVWSIGSPIGKYKLDKDFAPHLDQFKRVLEIADILGARRVRMFSFWRAAEQSPEAVKEAVFQRLYKMLEVTPSNILLCHENEKNIFGENTENCLAIHKEFPAIRAVFDPANFVQCGVDTLKAWEALKEYVDYMHVKDAIADGTVVPAGEGLGNVEYIARDYLRRGGETFTLEPHLAAFVGLTALENGESVKAEGKRYANNDEAFDAAADALKRIIMA